MHNHNDSNNSSMMWMMLICCLAPFVFLLIAGKGLALPGWGWLIGLAFIGMMGFHFWRMRRSHGKHTDGNTTAPGPDKQNTNSEQENPDERERH